MLRQRIGLLRHAIAAGADDIELVARAFGDARDEQLPHAGAVAQTHRVAPRVPGVEITDHRDAAGIRRPHGEARAAHAVDGHHVGAERMRQLEVPAFAEQVQVDVAEQGSVRVGVLGFLHDPARPGDAQQIRRALAHDSLKQAVLDMLQPPDARAIGAAQHLGELSARQEGAHDPPGRGLVRTEHPEWIAVKRMRERLGFVARNRRRRGRGADVHRPLLGERTRAASCARP